MIHEFVDDGANEYFRLVATLLPKTLITLCLPLPHKAWGSLGNKICDVNIYLSYEWCPGWGRRTESKSYKIVRGYRIVMCRTSRQLTLDYLQPDTLGLNTALSSGVYLIDWQLP